METTLREWFNRFTEKTGDIPTHIVFGQESDWPNLPTGITHWLEVPDAVLDHEFYSGYGPSASPDLCAWSDSWVLFSDVYDGAESLCWVPRHPRDHNPIRPGGQ